MADIIIETVKVDKVSQIKRVMCYWFAFQKIKAEEVDKVLADYEKNLAQNENWIGCYRDFFNNLEINDEQEILRLYDYVVEEKDESIKEQLKQVWKNVKAVIDKEIDCEKNLHRILNEKAKNHPIISKIIIAVLTMILMGLIEDCIHDGIQMAYQQKNSMPESIYIMDVDNHYTQIIYRDDKIYINEEINIDNNFTQ